MAVKPGAIAPGRFSGHDDRVGVCRQDAGGGERPEWLGERLRDEDPIEGVRMVGRPGALAHDLSRPMLHRKIKEYRLRQTRTCKRPEPIGDRDARDAREGTRAGDLVVGQVFGMASLRFRSPGAHA